MLTVEEFYKCKQGKTGQMLIDAISKHHDAGLAELPILIVGKGFSQILMLQRYFIDICCFVGIPIYKTYPDKTIVIGSEQAKYMFLSIKQLDNDHSTRGLDIFDCYIDHFAEE